MSNDRKIPVSRSKLINRIKEILTEKKAELKNFDTTPEDIQEFMLEKPAMETIETLEEFKNDLIRGAFDE